jgi:hypothetical protein
MERGNSTVSFFSWEENMNCCSICGGGIDIGYTAPEARCRCFEKDPHKVSEAKHEVLLAESRLLNTLGWKAVDIKPGSGFIWHDEKGQGPFSHQKAMEIQKERDSDPVAALQFQLEVRHQKVYERKEAKLKKHQPVGAEDRELSMIIKLMNKNIPDDKHSGNPPHR